MSTGFQRSRSERKGIDTSGTSRNFNSLSRAGENFNANFDLRNENIYTHRFTRYRYKEKKNEKFCH